MDERIRKYQQHIASAFQIGCHVTIRQKDFSGGGDIFCLRCPRSCDYRSMHLYGCYESARWDKKYIYYCPLGVIFIAVPIDLGILQASVISGPLLMGPPEDFPERHGLPHFETARVNDLAEIISAVFAPDSAAPPRQKLPATY